MPLPRPRVISLLSVPGELSLQRMVIQYEPRTNLSVPQAWQARRIIKRIARGCTIRREDGVLGTELHLDFGDASDETAGRIFLDLLDTFKPRLSSCIARILTARQGRHHGAIIVVNCMTDPKRDRARLHRKLADELKPLGTVRLLENAAPKQENVFRLVINPYNPPEDLERMLDKALENAGLDLGTSQEAELSWTEFLAQSMSPRISGPN